MKLMIWIGLTLGGLLGGWLGSFADGGSFLSFWGIVGSTVGSLAGIWAGYVIGNNYL